MKEKQRKLGTEYYLTASDESGNWGGITVFSIKYRKRSLKKSYFIKFQIQILSPSIIFTPGLYIVPNIRSSHSQEITKLKRIILICKKSGNHPICRISCTKGY